MAAAKANKKKKRKKTGPNAGLMISILVIGVGLAYGATFFLKKDPAAPSETKPVAENKAWYKTHAHAPEMIRLPDAPLIIAAVDAEIDETIKEIGKPKKPIAPNEPKPKPTVTIASKPRVDEIAPASKPELPKPPAVYEEALPEDVYTPVIAQIKPAAPITPKTVEATAEPIIKEVVPIQEARWMRYALKVTPAPNKPLIAVVIDDLGLDRKRTQKTLELPGPMTMAFIPYSKNLDRQTKNARDNGHELLLHLPMEPTNPKIDAGPNHLHTHLSADDLEARIHWNLNRFEGYVGVNNHMGSKATTDTTVMKALMEELRTREMLFLDSRTNAKSVGAKLAGLEGVPFAERNVFLDNVNEKGAVLKQLEILKNVALKSGFAVGIGHPRDATIAALKDWIPEIREQGFELVPISHIVMKNQGLS